MSLTADLAEFIAGHRREVYRNDWTGLTEPRVGGRRWNCLRQLGWIRPEAVIARDGLILQTRHRGGD